MRIPARQKLDGMIKLYAVKEKEKPMAVTIYYENDVNPEVIKGKKVAIIGYGSQGHAHALNLMDSGVDVRVGLREGSKSWAKAEEAGLKVMLEDEAAEEADVIMILIPDELQPEVYEQHIAPHLACWRYARFRAWLQYPLWLHQGSRGR